MWNILIGIVFIIGGLSGQLTIRGTSSSGGLAILGAGLMIWGIIQMASSKKSDDARMTPAQRRNHERTSRERRRQE